MKELSAAFPNLRTESSILILSVINALFWSFGKSINVYSSAVVGAIFEILWLPAMTGLFILPVLSIVFWIKRKFDVRSASLYSAVIAIATVVVTVFFNKQ